MRHPSPVLSLAAQSLLNRKLTAALTVIAVALSVMLFAGVEKIRDGARAGFERTISGTDLIVGARSGPVNLLLYSVFRIGDATSNVSWETYRHFATRPEVAWTVPLSLGDSHRGFRVVGTTGDFFEHYRYSGDRRLALAEGAVFGDVFDAVLGAEVAHELGYALGDEIVIAHGLGAVSFAEHDDRPFRVAGILAPTGTPVDRSVHVTLEGIEAIHVGWESGVRNPFAPRLTPEAISEIDLRPDQVTAFLVGLKSKVAALRLQREINTYSGEALLAIIPGVALNRLWQVVGVAERALTAISLFVIAVGLTGILTNILMSLNERRREMAILRAVGARPRDVFLLLVSEAGLLAFAGGVLGIALLHGALALAAPAIEARFGLALAGLEPGLFEAAVIAGVTVAALLLGAAPAWRAYRDSLADGLTVRT